MQYIGYATIM